MRSATSNSSRYSSNLSWITDTPFPAPIFASHGETGSNISLRPGKKDADSPRGHADGGCRRLGVFGGTFDPPHAGHIAAVTAVLHQGVCDQVVFVPAGTPWQKAGRDDLSSPDDRYAMTVLLARELSACTVSRVEIDRPGPSYTADTLVLFRERFPDTELLLILGADAAIGLPTWHRAEEVLALAQLAVVPRPDSGTELLELAERLEGKASLFFVDMEPVDLSSTGVRCRLGRGECGLAGLPVPVEEYIRKRGLYGTR